LAIPVLRWSFGIIKWHQEEIQKLDRKTRKIINTHNHPKAHIDNLYATRKKAVR